MKKIIFIGILSFLVIAAAGTVAFLTNRTITNPEYHHISKSDEKDILKYLKTNSSAVFSDGIQNFDDLKLLKPQLQKNDVFIAGESKYISKNYDAQMYILKYLNESFGGIYLFIEQGYSTSKMINTYLNTGDESILKGLFSGFVETGTECMESYNFWLELYKYNNSLPEDKRVVVVGIDIENQRTDAFRYLYQLLPQGTAPEAIRENINYLRENFNKKYISDGDFIEKLKNDIFTNQIDYLTYLRDNYFEFAFITGNIYNSKQFYGSNEQNDELHEEYIKENFKTLYNRLPKRKYFGQWSIDHIYLKEKGGIFSSHKSMASFLNNEFLPTKGKVLSIAYFYQSCNYMVNSGKQEDGVQAEVSGVALTKKFATTDYTLINFNGKNSPFAGAPFYVKNPDGGSTVDYYQFGLVIRNSPAAQPYRAQE